MSSATQKGRRVIELPGRRQTQRPLLGELLVARGVVTAEEVREGLCRQQESGQLLGQILIQMGALTPAQLARALEEQKRLEEDA